jgi:RNAse (barnase) inhibitor barstar
MYSVDKFEFTTAAPDKADVTIDRSAQGKQDLLAGIAQGLSFPDYFGENWDALIDCLSDLSWVQTPETIIDHAGIPQLSTRDLRLYLESLIDAADRRTPEMVPKLRILFRIDDREMVASALNPS